MKALTYHGPHHVRVDNVPDPGIEQPDDIILPRRSVVLICIFIAEKFPRSSMAISLVMNLWARWWSAGAK